MHMKAKNFATDSKSNDTIKVNASFDTVIGLSVRKAVKKNKQVKQNVIKGKISHK